MSLEKVFNSIDNSRGYAVKLLSKLVSIPTVNPPGEKYFEFCDFLRGELEELGLDVRVKQVPDEYLKKHLEEKCWSYPRYILIARLGEASNKPTLHFNGHYDVVPAGSGWTKTEAFKPKVAGDLVYGRGTTDMKGGIVSVVVAVKSILDEGCRLRGCFEFSATPDEETGGETGVGYMLNEGLIKPDYAIIAEPSGMDNVYFGHKGGVWLKVTVYGRQAHGSTPWKGVNAFEKMVKAANALMDKLKPKLSGKVSKYETNVPGGGVATMNMGGIVSGGAKVNIVPGEVSFTIDRRIIPEETAEEAVKEIEETLEEVKREDPDFRYRVEVRGKFNPCITSPNSTIAKIVSGSIRDVLGREGRLTMCVGGLDMRYFVNAGVEALTYGPGEIDAAHAADEYIRIGGLLNVSKVYASTIMKLIGEV